MSARGLFTLYPATLTYSISERRFCLADYVFKSVVMSSAGAANDQPMDALYVGVVSLCLGVPALADLTAIYRVGLHNQLVTVSVDGTLNREFYNYMTSPELDDAAYCAEWTRIEFLVGVLGGLKPQGGRGMRLLALVDLLKGGT